MFSQRFKDLLNNINMIYFIDINQDIIQMENDKNI